MKQLHSTSRLLQLCWLAIIACCSLGTMACCQASPLEVAPTVITYRPLVKECNDTHQHVTTAVKVDLGELLNDTSLDDSDFVMFYVAGCTFDLGVEVLVPSVAVQGIDASRVSIHISNCHFAVKLLQITNGGRQSDFSDLWSLIIENNTFVGHATRNTPGGLLIRNLLFNTTSLQDGGDDTKGIQIRDIAFYDCSQMQIKYLRLHGNASQVLLRNVSRDSNRDVTGSRQFLYFEGIKLYDGALVSITQITMIEPFFASSVMYLGGFTVDNSVVYVDDIQASMTILETYGGKYDSGAQLTIGNTSVSVVTYRMSTFTNSSVLLARSQVHTITQRYAVSVQDTLFVGNKASFCIARSSLSVSHAVTKVGMTIWFYPQSMSNPASFLINPKVCCGSTQYTTLREYRSFAFDDGAVFSITDSELATHPIGTIMANIHENNITKSCCQHQHYRFEAWFRNMFIYFRNVTFHQTSFNLGLISISHGFVVEQRDDGRCREQMVEVGNGWRCALAPGGIVTDVMFDMQMGDPLTASDTQLLVVNATMVAVTNRTTKAVSIITEITTEDIISPSAASMFHVFTTEPILSDASLGDTIVFNGTGFLAAMPKKMMVGPCLVDVHVVDDTTAWVSLPRPSTARCPMHSFPRPPSSMRSGSSYRTWLEAGPQKIARCFALL